MAELGVRCGPSTHERLSRPTSPLRCRRQRAATWRQRWCVPPFPPVRVCCSRFQGAMAHHSPSCCLQPSITGESVCIRSCAWSTAVDSGMERKKNTKLRSGSYSSLPRCCRAALLPLPLPPPGVLPLLPPAVAAAAAAAASLSSAAWADSSATGIATLRITSTCSVVQPHERPAGKRKRICRHCKPCRPTSTAPCTPVAGARRRGAPR